MQASNSGKGYFLGIGVQRSASSWLHFHLRNHPEIFMPKRKELHYFSSSTIYPSQSRLSVPRFSQRLLASPNIRKEVFKNINMHCRNLLNSADISAFAQGIKFELAHYSDQWYLSQLDSGDGRLRGEITPAYSFLEPQDIERVLRLLPNVKIILTLRDPIDRSVSQLRHVLQNGFIKPSAQAIDNFVGSRGLALRNDYPSMIANWRSALKSDSFFLDYYDNLQTNQEEFLGNIFHFLGVDTHFASAIKATLSEKHNQAIARDKLPNDLELRLAKTQIPMLERLYADLGAVEVENWLKRAETIIANNC